MPLWESCPYMITTELDVIFNQSIHKASKRLKKTVHKLKWKFKLDWVIIILDPFVVGYEIQAPWTGVGDK